MTHKTRRGREIFTRFDGNPILTARDWPYPVNTVFNPAAGRREGETLVLARVEGLEGPSYLSLARSADGKGDWAIETRPALIPDPEAHPEEAWGIEDPRMTWLDEKGAWAVLYTAYSPVGAGVAMALTEDFETWQRLGLVMLPENKDAALFPVRFDGRWAMIHRPVPGGAGAHVWISFSDDLVHWGEHRPLLLARSGPFWDAGRIGLNAPPLATKAGWLIVYHGVKRTCSGALYRLGLALLDRDDPTRVLHRTPEWVFGPRETCEMTGDVGGVTFPCGWVHRKETDELCLYYGGADSVICLATAGLGDVLDYVVSCPAPEPAW